MLKEGGAGSANRVSYSGNLRVSMYRYTMYSFIEALLSKSGKGALETGSLWSQAGFLYKPNAFFTHNRVLFESGVFMLGVIGAVVRSPAFQPGQR